MGLDTWTYHSTYRGFDIESYTDTGYHDIVSYRAFLDGQWRSSTSLATVQGYIDDYIDPSTRIFIETYRGINIYYGPYADMYFYTVDGEEHFQPTLEQARVHIDTLLDEPDPHWEYHSTYRGIDIQVWMPDETHYTAYFDGEWHTVTSLSTLKAAIDDYLDERVFVETYRGIDIYYEAYSDMYYYTVHGVEHFQPTLEQARGHIDTLIEEPPCPNPENLWPWYGGQPYYAIPIWIETYKDWNIWHLAEVGAVYGITTPDCVAYSQSSFSSSVTAARTKIDGLAEVQEPFTTILDFIVPESLPENSDVNVRVLLKNTGGATGYLSCVINGNIADPDRVITAETGSTSPTTVAPGNSMWLDIYFRYFKMPSWDLNLIARNYDGTSQISKTISLEAPAVGIPTTLTLSAPDKAGVGEKFYISGILYETDAVIPIPNQPINHSYNGKNLGTSITGVDGIYLKEASVPETGVWTLKSEFPGTETLQASKSQADAIVSASLLETVIKIAAPATIGLASIIYCLR